MDVWAGYAMRRKACDVCTVRLEPGDRVIITQTKRAFPWGVRTRRRSSHFDCWVAQAHLYLDGKPYVPVIPISPGRRRQYTPEHSKRRIYLQITISKWHKQQRGYLNDGMWAMADRYKDKISVLRNELADMPKISDDVVEVVSE